MAKSRLAALGVGAQVNGKADVRACRGDMGTDEILQGQVSMHPCSYGVHDWMYLTKPEPC